MANEFERKKTKKSRSRKLCLRYDGEEAGMRGLGFYVFASLRLASGICRSIRPALGGQVDRTGRG